MLVPRAVLVRSTALGHTELSETARLQREDVIDLVLYTCMAAYETTLCRGQGAENVTHDLYDLKQLRRLTSRVQ